MSSNKSSGSRSRAGCGLALALRNFWKAFLQWSVEPLKGCWYYCEDALGARLDSMGNLHDYDEEDMTWVEYQWLARNNHESPRMRRPPPRLHEHQSLVKKFSRDGNGVGDGVSPPTPPVTPPSNSNSSVGAAGGGRIVEFTRRRSVGVVTEDDIKKLQASFSFPVIEGMPLEGEWKRRCSSPRLTVVV